MAPQSVTEMLNPLPPKQTAKRGGKQTSRAIPARPRAVTKLRPYTTQAPVSQKGMPAHISSMLTNVLLQLQQQDESRFIKVIPVPHLHDQTAH